MSSNLEDIERSTDFENLIILKKEIKRFQNLFGGIVEKCEVKNDSKIIVTTFITMLYGYYTIAFPIEAQKKQWMQPEVQ